MSKKKKRGEVIGSHTKTAPGLQFVVIDHEGSPSLDNDGEPQSFEAYNFAVERAKQLAEVDPGLPVVIYQKLATVQCEVNNPSVKMHAKFLEQVKS